MNAIVEGVESLPPDERFVPAFNTYVFSAYNTLNIGRFNWYVEGAYKTREAIDYGFGFKNVDGSCIYTTLAYTQKGLGVTASFKRTQDFQLISTPTPTIEGFNANLLYFIPPTARQNSLRLPARYFANSLNQEELAWSVEGTASPTKKLTLNFSLSYIRNLMNNSSFTEREGLIADDGQIFFGELYFDANYRISKKAKIMAGLQVARYNEQVFIQEPVDTVVAYTPFTEFVYKFDRKKSIKLEVQYQYTPKDYGQWIYALLEFNIAPNWSFSISDMWNFEPNNQRFDRSDEDYHYYSFFASYRHKAHRFSVTYVRQVAGIVCTGGVCRLEPAFNGARIGYTTSF
jgi:hypothetical protein